MNIIFNNAGWFVMKDGGEPIAISGPHSIEDAKHIAWRTDNHCLWWAVQHYDGNWVTDGTSAMVVGWKSTDSCEIKEFVESASDVTIDSSKS